MKFFNMIFFVLVLFRCEKLRLKVLIVNVFWMDIDVEYFRMYFG